MKTTAFLVGVVFALGLGLSGMTDPRKIIAFLDLFGAWNPSLIFVMVGAIGFHFIAYRLIRRRVRPVLVKQWHIPTTKAVTPRLLIGAILFGIGWGLSGYCPGPAVVSLLSLRTKPMIFILGLIGGMYLFSLADRRALIDYQKTPSTT